MFLQHSISPLGANVRPWYCHRLLHRLFCLWSQSLRDCDRKQIKGRLKKERPAPQLAAILEAACECECITRPNNFAATVQVSALHIVPQVKCLGKRTTQHFLKVRWARGGTGNLVESSNPKEIVVNSSFSLRDMANLFFCDEKKEQQKWELEDCFSVMHIVYKQTNTDTKSLF